MASDELFRLASSVLAPPGAPGAAAPPEAASLAAFAEFAGQPTCLALRVSTDGASAALTAATGSVLVAAAPSAARQVLFVKRRAAALRTRDDVAAEVMLLTTGGGTALHGLYAAVHNLYVPALADAAAGTPGRLPTAVGAGGGSGATTGLARLRSTLLELDRGLASRLQTFQLGADASAGDGDAGIAPEAASPRDELDGYCAELRRRGGRAALRADAFEMLLAPLVEQMELLRRTPLARLPDAVDAVGAGLDALWRARLAVGLEGYPRGRMLRLLTLGEEAVLACVDWHLGRAPLLGAGGGAAATLAACARACDDWAASVRVLTASRWPAVEWHPWPRGPDAVVAADGAARLQARLGDLLAARHVYDAVVAVWPTALLRAPHALPSATTTARGGDNDQADTVDRAVADAFAVVADAAADADRLLAGSDDGWARLLALHERQLSALDEPLAGVLRAGVAAGTAPAAPPSQLASWVAATRPLWARPSLLRATAPARATALAQLVTDLDALEAEVRERARRGGASLRIDADVSGSGAAGGDGADVTAAASAVGVHIAEVRWARDAATRVASTAPCGSVLFNDLPGGTDLADASAEVTQRLADYQASVFDAWCRSYEVALRGGRLAADAGRDAAPLLAFDGGGSLVVSTPPALTAFVRDCSHWAELSTPLAVDVPSEEAVEPSSPTAGGKRALAASSSTSPLPPSFALPEPLRRALADSERFSRLAARLREVAARYNALHAQITAAHMPLLLLGPLMAFERLVADAGGSSADGALLWTDTDRAGRYVDALTGGVDAVAAGRAALTAANSAVAEQAAALSGLSLLRQRDAWRAALAAFGDAVRSTLIGVSAPQQAAPWLAECGAQLYGAVEAAFRASLASFHEALPEIRLELGYSHAERAVVFRPPLADVRASYGRELKKLLAAPPAAAAAALGPPTVGGLLPPALAARFAAMHERCGDATDDARRKGDALFARLERLRESLQPWMALDAAAAAAASLSGGGVGGATATATTADDALDALVEAGVSTCDDYEAGFASSRAKRRDADRLPDLHRVDCVTVSVLPFKRAVDGLLQRTYESLLVSLRRRTGASAAGVEEYLHGGLEALRSPLASLDAITRAAAKWRALVEGRPAMRAASDALGAPRRLLEAAAAGSAYDVADVCHRVGRLPALWDEFDAAMDAFTAATEAQRAALRDGVAGQVVDVAARADRLAQRWAALRPGAVDTDATGAGTGGAWSRASLDARFASLTDWHSQVASVRTAATAVSDAAAGFGLEPPVFPSLDAVEAELAAVAGAWERYRAYDAERSALAAADWISFRGGRVHELADFAGRWAAAPVAAAVPPTAVATAASGAAAPAVAARIAAEVNALRAALPALKLARGECFREEHWEALFAQLRLPRGSRLEALTVGHFLGALGPLAASAAWLKELTARAQGEVALREALGEVRAWADTAALRLGEHVSPATGARTPLVREWREALAAVGDNQAVLQSLKASPHYRPFADAVAALEARLTQLDGVCLSLAALQRKWAYLEPVFARGALPAEAPRFRRVDELLRGVMRRLAADPRLLPLADADTFPGLPEAAAAGVEALDRCQRALGAYLQERRAAFPRFFFLGDDDLLEVLGRGGSDAAASVLQPHLRKLFQGIHALQTAVVEPSPPQQQQQGRAGGAPQATIVTAVISAASEVVPLRSPVPVTADVAAWLAALVDETAATLRCLLAAYLRDETQQQPWEARRAAYPSQVHCLGEQVVFTRDVEAALSAGAGAQAALAAVRARLEAAVAAYTTSDVAAIGGGDNALAATQVRALALDAVHHLDVLEQLRSKDVKSPASWQWQKQLRFYYHAPPPGSGDDAACAVTARMVDAAVPYSWEYQGNPPRLVHSPLTDKCFLVLTQALARGLGGNPYGPAGTGKTEHVKALGGALGRQVLVFNCDEGVDAGAMGRMFAGIVRCGAFGCFDEFNRLREGELSAVSQAVQAVQDAIRGRAASVRLNGADVPVDARAAIFVTLNPASRGYGGRSRLPDNLAQLFRPVAMTTPDSDLIAEVSLQADGFAAARPLGRRLVAALRLCGQLLSQQVHYDFGLRALKVVLGSAGAMAARARQARRGGGSTPLPPIDEGALVVEALRVNTLSKLTPPDTPRFHALVTDVFPDVTLAAAGDAALEEAVRSVMEAWPPAAAPTQSAAPPAAAPAATGSSALVFNPGQLAKVLQLREALTQRVGCVVVGPAGTGKSTLWRVLVAALRRTGTRVGVHVVNPKAMPRDRLLGHTDGDTREWTDGVLTAAARAATADVAAATPSVPTRSLVVLDGDVDPEWVEALNSVLDDNRLLTLPNGERIAFPDGVNLLFETADLRHASPATVSRMGMVLLSDDDVDPRRLVAAWLAAPRQQALPPATLTALTTHLDALLYRTLDWIRARPASSAPVPSLSGVVSSCLSQAAGCTSRVQVAVAVLRGAGGCLPVDDRFVLARQLADWAGLSLPAGATSSLLDAYADPSGAEALLQYASASAPLPPLTRAGVLTGAVVPTPSLQRAVDTLRPSLAHGDPVLVVGPPGCGRALLVRHGVAQLRSGIATAGGGTTRLALATVPCTSQTGAPAVVAALRSACVLTSSSRGRTLRPRDADRLVLLVRDVDLPAPDAYGTVDLVAFLQQLLAHGGFYDDHREFVHVERVQLVATATAFGGDGGGAPGRHPLPPRFTGAVHIVAVDAPPPAELAAICTAYLQAAVQGQPRQSDPRLATPAGLARLGATMVDVYAAVAEPSFGSGTRSAQPTPLFSPSLRDLVGWVRGLLRYDLGTPLLAAVVAEARYAFRDRLASDDDHAAFDGVLAAAFTTQWGALPDGRDAVFTSLLAPSAAAPLLSFASGGAPLVRTPSSDFTAALRRAAVLYEREERELGLDFTPQVAAVAASLDRVLTADGGHALLVGQSGVGKRSLTALLSHAHGHTLVHSSPGRAYSDRHIRGDLKAGLAVCGVRGEPVTLLLEARHLAGDPAVLETVVSLLLCGGDLAGLYDAAELEQLLAPLKEPSPSSPAAGSEGDDGGDTSSAVTADASPLGRFTARVRRHLHVVVSVDGGSSAFAAAVARHPALLSRAATVWCPEWTAATLREVGAAVLRGDGGSDGAGGGFMASLPDPALGEALLDAAVAIYSHQRQQHEQQPLLSSSPSSSSPPAASPRHFVFLLRCLASVHRAKAAAARADEARLSAGLATLADAQQRVDELTTEARGQRVALTAKQAAADAAMADIAAALTSASDRRREVDALAAQLAEAEGRTRLRQDAVAAQLAGVQPVLDAARAAVGGIRKEHLDEIRSLKMPPEPVADVLGAVLTMLGVGDTSWHSMKRVLAGRGVKDDILALDARRVAPDALRAVHKIVRAKADSFDRADAVSKAAGPLAAWVRATLTYAAALEQAAPLQAELDAAAAQASAAAEAVAANRDELDAVDGRVAALKAEFAARTGEAEVLRHALAATEATLTRATSLLADLAGERERWRAQLGALAASSAALPVHAFLAAAFVAFLGAATEADRAHAQQAWVACVRDALVAHSSQLAPATRDAVVDAPSSFSLLAVLGSETTAAAWRDAGLPADALSTDNALALAASQSAGRAVLLLDPAGAATDWLQARLEADAKSSAADGSGSGGTPCDVVSAGDTRLLQAVELAARFGKAVLIRDVGGGGSGSGSADSDPLPPFLYPLLRRETTVSGGRPVIRVGDRLVDFHDRFRLYLASRSPSLPLPPAAGALVTTLSFTVTSSGLEAQLLAEALRHDDPSLEARTAALARDAEALRAQLAGVEDALLAALAGSSGSLLDNAPLLASLQASKANASAIGDALAASSAASAQLVRQRDTYRPLAAAGARAYFCVDGLAAVNPMYRFSTAFFTGVFRRALADAPAATSESAPQQQPSTSARVAAVTARLEQLLLVAVGEGLMKADRLLWALRLLRAVRRPAAFAVGDGSDGDNDAVWRLLVSDDASVTGSGTEPAATAMPPWAPRSSTAAFAALFHAAPRLVWSLLAAPPEPLAAWVRSPAPEAAELPPGLPQSPSPNAAAATRLLLVRVFRPDRLLPALTGFACAALGVASLNPPPAQLGAVAESTPPATPLLLVTAAGADPSRELAELAAACLGTGGSSAGGDGSGGYVEIALGGGGAQQGEAALAAVRSAAVAGGWVCLKNLHLVAAGGGHFLPALDAVLGGLSAPTTGSGAGATTAAAALHPRFRLWLTTEPHAGLPGPLLQRCRKVTLEAPPGVRNNMTRTLQAWGDGVLGGGGNSGAGGGVTRCQLLFLLAWLHAVAQERCKYVPQGWTKAYAFSAADLHAGVGVIDAMLPRGGGGGGDSVRVPWAFIHGLMENAVYGGRVDNPWDARVLRAYLAHALHPEVLAAQRSVSRGVALPHAPSLADCLRCVASMPEADAPSLFALPPSVERLLHAAAVRYTTSGLRALTDTQHPMSAGGDTGNARTRFDRDTWRARLAPLLTTWRQATPMAAAPACGTTKQSTAALPDPVADFLQLEVALSGRLAAVVDTDVAAIQAAIDGGGASAPSPAALAVASALLADNVPTRWSAHWQGPPQPAAWLAGLARRRFALPRWCAAAASGSLLQPPAPPVALRELFRPAAFLSALRQAAARQLCAAATTARAAPVSAESLRLVAAFYRWTPPLPSVPVVTLGGLRLQGAAWDAARGGLAEVRQAAGDDVDADAAVDGLHPSPDVTLAWLPPGVPDQAPPPSIASAIAGGQPLAVPLYQHTDREAVVAELAVPCGADRARWVLGGVAFFVE